MIMPDAEPWISHAARYEEEQGRVPPRKGEWICTACRAPNQSGMTCAVCGEVRQQRRQPVPWACEECGA
jgi:RNase P subunit RPR2